MKRWQSLAALALLLTALAATYLLLRKTDPVYPGQARWVLEAPDSVDVLALDGADDPRNANLPGHFFNQKILRTVHLTNPHLQHQLLTALQQEATPKPEGVVKGCLPLFLHGLSARRGSHEVQLEICYGCGELFIAEGHDSRYLDAAPGPSESLFNQALAPPPQTSTAP